MITVKKEKLLKCKSWTDDTIHVLTDFDRTITVGTSESSWSVLSKSDLVPKEYVIERQELYNKYRPIETDETIDFETKNKLVSEWFYKHICLFVKYKLSESVVNEAARNLRVMAFREGAKEFLENMKQRNIPVIIISAGIGNFIKQFLIKNNCDFDNIYIVSNFIKFENGVAVGVSDNIIHSLNKNEVSVPNKVKSLLVSRPNIILLGDGSSDVKMAQEDKRKDALKIGFLEENVENNRKVFEENFDIVCTDNTSFKELSEVINIL